MGDQKPEAKTEQNSDVDDSIFVLRPFRKDAYRESWTSQAIDRLAKTPEDASKMHDAFSANNIRNFVAWAGIIILSLITLTSLYILIRHGAEKDNKIVDEAVRFLTLILGAVLGTLYRAQSDKA